MSPSTLGAAIAGAVVAISSALTIRLRKPVASGVVQRYPRIARVFVLVFALLLLAMVIAVYGAAPPSTAKAWIGMIGGLSLALFSFGTYYYYRRMAVRVSPDSIVVAHPFRGTLRLTHENLISMHQATFMGASITTFVFDDGGRQTLRLPNSKFDVRAFSQSVPPAPVCRERAAAVRRLEAAGVPRRNYAFDAATHECQFVCRRAPAGRFGGEEVWQVAYFERGAYHFPRTFESEAEAYDYFVRIQAQAAKKTRRMRKTSR